MQRRDFLKFLRKPAIAAAAVLPAVSAMSASAYDAAREKERAAAAALRSQVKALNERIDAIDKNYKRTVKAGLVVIAGLLGIDISSAL